MFSNLFKPKKNNNTLIDEFTDQLYISVLSRTDGVFDGYSGFVIDKQYEFNVVLLLSQGLLQVIDRKSFEILGDKRDELMDRIMLIVAAKIIKTYSPNDISTEQFTEMVKKCVEENNKMMIYLSFFKKIMSKDEVDGKPENTLVREFGRLFSIAINHENDELQPLLGGVLLLDTVESLNIEDFLYKCI